MNDGNGERDEWNIIYSIDTNKWYLSRPLSSYVRIKFVHYYIGKGRVSLQHGTLTNGIIT